MVFWLVEVFVVSVNRCVFLAAVDSSVPVVGYPGYVGAGRGGVAASIDPSQRLPGAPTADTAEGEPTMEGQAPETHGRNHQWH